MESVERVADLMGKEDEFVFVHVDVRVSVGHLSRNV